MDIAQRKSLSDLPKQAVVTQQNTQLLCGEPFGAWLAATE